MYPLPKDADLSFLLGVDLLQLCVGKNELILNFDRNVRLTLLSDVNVIDSNGRSTLYEEPTRAAVALFPLLHEPVVGARATDQGGLLLTFQSGLKLEVLDTSAEYESFWISHGGHLIVV